MSAPATEVLLVDDAEAPRLTFAALLEDAGYRVTEAGSLSEARRCLEAATPRLAILDHQLGDGHGTELVPVLASRGAVVVMLSGTPLGRIEGVAAVLTKSESPEALLRSISDALQRGAWR